MKFTGKYRTMTSEKYGPVSILEYKSDGKHSVPYEFCSRCGKPLIRTMYVVQDSDEVECEYIGPECVKKFV